MNEKQMNAAKKSMIEWLSHPNELGKIPSKIECTGSFEYYNMTYYIFKYKKSAMGKWLLAVCGGYEENSPEHGGHIFSEMEEYNELTAEEKCKEMIDMIREYWMSQAENHKENQGTFVGFILLSENSWNKQQFIDDLKSQWDIDAIEEKDENEDEKTKDNIIIFSVDEDVVAVSLMPAPIPENEAEENAKNNYMWPDAVEVAKEHKAHLMVAILGNDNNYIEKGKLLVKVMACCCNQKNATGVYTSGTVFEPCYYNQFANIMKDGELPILNWIWFGLYIGQEGVCCYTYGMDVFGKDEMEVLNVDAKPSDIRDFLASLVSYVLKNDVVLHDGETIGFSADDIHKITRSEGVSLPGMTLKIEYN